MSTVIISACWPLQMPPTPKAVLISLADNANDHGECWPSIPTIAMRTCFSERAVHRAIRWLEEAGALVADRSNGRHTRYRITPESCRPLAEVIAPPQMRHPRKSGSPANAAVKPPQMRQEPLHMRQEPLPEMRSNHQEPSRTVRSNRQPTKMPPAADLLPGVPPDVVRDYLILRKEKKAPLTEIAAAGLRREAEKAGMSLEEVLRTCCERGWAGFKHEWTSRGPTLLPADAPPGGGRRAL